MKKLVAWLMKGTRIVKILKYIYKTVVIVNNSLIGISTGLAQADKTVPTKLEDTCKYLNICANALARVLSWLGFSGASERAAFVNEPMTTEILEKELNELLEEGDKVESSLTFQ